MLPSGSCFAPETFLGSLSGTAHGWLPRALVWPVGGYFLSTTDVCWSWLELPTMVENKRKKKKHPLARVSRDAYNQQHSSV